MRATAGHHASFCARRVVLRALTAAIALPLSMRAIGAPMQPVASVPERIVVMDWSFTETLLALGCTPVGVSLPDWYRSTVVDPVLPKSVADIGLLYQPNFEMLLALKPDLMIVTPQHAGLLPALHRIAPTLTPGHGRATPDAFARLVDETRSMAHALHVDARADALIDATQACTREIRERVAAHPDLTRHPVIFAEAVDAQHLRLFGAKSLPDAALASIGAVNAINASPHDRWPTDGVGTTVVSLPDIAGGSRAANVQNASLIFVGPLKPDVRVSLEQSALWRVLPAVRDHRVTVLPVISPYGGLVSMQRFARAFEASLATLASGGGGLA